MNRRGDSRLLFLSVAAGLAVLLVAAPGAAAAETALDEYTLDFPGTRADGKFEAGALAAGPGGPYSRQGTAGENEAATSPLDASVTTFLGSSPLLALLLVAALGSALYAAQRLNALRSR